ncbi:MAG: SIR2 family protein [Phycisphaerales bacterium]
MFESDLLVLTGAGASVPVGIPAMQGMAAGFRKSLSRSSALLRSLDFLRDLGSKDDLEDLLQHANALIELPGQPLERFVQTCVAMRSEKRISDYEKRRDERLQGIKELRSALLQWINESCLKFRRDDAVRIFSDIISVLADKRIPLYTTNYDAVPDYVARLGQIPVFDNFQLDRLGRYFWDPGLASFAGNGLQLVKMHGSIHWHASDDGVVERLSQPALLNQEGKPLQRLLIFPTRFKDIYAQHYFPLYTSFTRALGKASALLIIGHSLRDEYLLAAVRERLTDTKFQLLVIDPVFSARSCLASPHDHADNKIVYINRGLEEVHEVVKDALSQPTASETAAYLRQAADRLARGEKETLEFASFPGWAAPGAHLEVELQIDTIKAEGKVEAWLDPEDGSSSTQLVMTRTQQGDPESFIEIKGLHSSCESVILELPEDLAPKSTHTVRVLVRNRDGQAAIECDRRLRIKKPASPKASLQADDTE